MAATPIKRELFVFPHPDDEVMLGHKIAGSPEARVVVATDGTASTVDHVGGGFVASGRRREESYNALEHLGVSRDRQFYLSLPDERLEAYVSHLHIALSSIIVQYAIDTVITLGEQGYDGHKDHLSSHVAALRAVHSLEDDARPTVLALNNQHRGEHIARGHTQRKLGAMAHHVSQFDLTNPTFWEDFSLYIPLISNGETYDELPNTGNAISAHS